MNHKKLTHKLTDKSINQHEMLITENKTGIATELMTYF